MGQNRQAGPGLYVCTNRDDSRSYGNLLVKVVAEPGVKVLDLGTGMLPPVLRNHGFSLQDVLLSTGLPCLMKYRPTFLAVKTHKGIDCRIID